MSTGTGERYSLLLFDDILQLLHRLFSKVMAWCILCIHFLLCWLLRCCLLNEFRYILGFLVNFSFFPSCSTIIHTRFTWTLLWFFHIDLEVGFILHYFIHDVILICSLEFLKEFRFVFIHKGKSLCDLFIFILSFLIGI